jgi:hypothetical protein
MKYLKYCFNMQSDGRTISHNLGNWKNLEKTKQRCKWQYYFQPSTSMIYYKNDDYYVAIVPYITRQSIAHFNRKLPPCQHERLPIDCVPAEIILHKKVPR